MDRRLAIVTGGSRGIGRAICLALAKKNINLVINYVGNHKKAAEVARECKKLGVDVLIYQADVSKMPECKKMIKAVVEKFARIDILINNAGINRDKLILRMSEEDFDQVIDVNLKGAFNCIKQASRHMVKKRYGRIIMLSSIVGQIGNIGQVNYGAAKAGLIGMTKSLARELAQRNITVNAVAPGFIKTDMTDKLSEDAVKKLSDNIPMKTLGQVEDVAYAVAFLVAEEAKYITGQVIGVNGGMAM